MPHVYYRGTNQIKPLRGMSSTESNKLSSDFHFTCSFDASNLFCSLGNCSWSSVRVWMGAEKKRSLVSMDYSTTLKIICSSFVFVCFLLSKQRFTRFRRGLSKRAKCVLQYQEPQTPAVDPWRSLWAEPSQIRYDVSEWLGLKWKSGYLQMRAVVGFPSVLHAVVSQERLWISTLPLIREKLQHTHTKSCCQVFPSSLNFLRGMQTPHIATNYRTWLRFILLYFRKILVQTILG